jgi:hypothetical protein
MFPNVGIVNEQPNYLSLDIKMIEIHLKFYNYGFSMECSKWKVSLYIILT